MPRLKVLHLITQLELGGAQENTLYTVGNLDPERFEPVLAAGPGGMLDEQARSLRGVPFHTLPWLVRPVAPHRDLGALAQILALLRRVRPHVLHTHSSKAGVLGRWAAAAAGVPIRVHSVHGFGFHAGGSSPMRHVLVAAERSARPLTTHWIAVSRANLEQGAALGLLVREKTTLIRSGIPLERFGRGTEEGMELRGELGLPRETPLVGAVACLKPQKAPVDLVRVAARVMRQVPAAHFALAGDGELRGAVERAVAEHGLGRRFHLLGWRRDVPRLLASFDLLLHTPLWEGLPRVLPEALASGRPVVATDVDGAREVVAEGINGFLRPAGDYDGLSSCVVRLLQDRGLRERLGAEGRRSIAEFDIRDMVRRQENLYLALAAGGRLGAGSQRSLQAVS